MSVLFDDETLGPLYRDPNKYTFEQLKQFSRHLAQKCYWFTERASFLCRAKPAEYLAFRNILFDSNLCRIRFVISRCNNPSKNLYLRLLHCFCACLRKYNAILEFDHWFFVPPPFNPPVVTRVTSTRATTTPSTSASSSNPAGARSIPISSDQLVSTNSSLNSSFGFNPDDPESSSYFLENPFE